MKLLNAIALAIVVGVSPAFAGGAHEPMHDGIVVEVKDVDLELVARADRIQLYLRDHGKPVDVTNGSARLTLLSGKSRQEVELKPAGDRFEAAGGFSVEAGTKLVAVVSLPGKQSITARLSIK